MKAFQCVPAFDEAMHYVNQEVYKNIPISKSIMADEYTPIEVLKILKKASHHCFILESVEDSKNGGRYTFLGYDPKLEITCKDYDLTVKSKEFCYKNHENPGRYIRKIIRENKSPIMKEYELPSFTGGLVGYFSYDYIKYAQPHLTLDALDEENFNDVDLMLFDKVIAFDNLKQQIIFIVNAKTENFEINYQRALADLEKMEQLIVHGKKEEVQPLQITTPFKELFEKEQFCQMVQKAQAYIYEGDIFQVVLSNRIEANMKGSLLDAYRMLRIINPSPYMFYFASDDIELAGASPETLVKLDSGELYTYPLAGTRKRGENKEEDERLEKELLADEKECAEHNMLVDLGRNDIGKISDIGSVSVEKYMEVVKFSHVMHISSLVKGKLKNDQDAVDAIDSILPAGTLSGAPKLRAVEIINKLENNKRGIYGGAIGYLDFTGNMDVCIAIRLMFAKNQKVFIRSGAGIVADSIPEKEYEECLNKAKAVMVALHEASHSTGGEDDAFANR